MNSPPPTPLYAYNPSAILAIVAVCFYIPLTALHLCRLLRTQTWSNIGMVVGGTAEVAGFIARLFSSRSTYNKPAYNAQSILLILGPSLLMITVVWTQVSFIHALGGASLGFLPAPWRQTTYIVPSMAGLAIQVIGVVLMAATTDIVTGATAARIIIAAYIIQIFLWLLVMAEGIVFQLRYGRKMKNIVQEVVPKWKRWNQLFGLAIMIICGRNLMRLTAIGMGPEGFLSINEWPSYAFDGYQMIVVMGAWGIFYLPGICAKIESERGRGWTDLESIDATTSCLQMSPSQDIRRSVEDASTATHIPLE